MKQCKKNLERLLGTVAAVMLCISSLLQVPVMADELKVYARAALLMDASNGRILYEENGYEKLPMASTTKIMTCILALEYIKEHETTVWEEPVEVSGHAASMPKVKLGVQKGDKFLLEDLLYSLMLESHNDTAVAIAEYIDGSVPAFAQRMNEKARSLGCRDTNFITPNGLDAEADGKTHETTAADLARIAAYALKNEDFRKIIGTRSYTFPELSGRRTFQVYNKDRFLDLMDGAIGIKTGFTGKAGYCFVGALERDKKDICFRCTGQRMAASQKLEMGRYEDADGIWTFQVYREVYSAALHLPAASCGGRHFGAGGDPAGERGQRKKN